MPGGGGCPGVGVLQITPPPGGALPFPQVCLASAVCTGAGTPSRPRPLRPCSACTFLNPPRALVCEVCDNVLPATARPVPRRPSPAPPGPLVACAGAPDGRSGLPPAEEDLEDVICLDEPPAPQPRAKRRKERHVGAASSADGCGSATELLRGDRSSGGSGSSEPRLGALQSQGVREVVVID